MNNNALNKFSDKENKRLRRNSLLFIISFCILGGIQGFIGDVYRSYINLSNPLVSNQLSMYIGISMILLVFLLLAVKKIGYKKIFLILSALMVIAFTTSIIYHGYYILVTDTILLQLGIRGFDTFMMLALMAYTIKENRIFIFTVAIISNVIFESIITIFDGKLLILIFKGYLGISYGDANLLTKYTGKLNSTELNYYIKSYHFLILIAIILTIITLILFSFIKENKVDYIKVGESKRKKLSIKDFKRVLKDKYIVSWVIYSTLIGIEINLVNQNLAIYLNRVLHISRGATSTILGIKSIGILVFLLIAPIIIKKLGSIKTFAILLILSSPLMIIIGEGKRFSSSVVVVLSIAVFLKYGFANALKPLQDSMPLTFVNKENRSIFVAVITLLNALTSIIVGDIGSKTLFTSAIGYNTLFFTFAGVYALCGILIYVVYYKKYNNFYDI